MIVEIITIGDEILAGNIVDTNKVYLSDVSWAHGFQVEYHTGVRDDVAAMHSAFKQASVRADVVLCTGGLGPTSDDFTIEAWASAFGLPLEWHEETLKALEQRKTNNKQAKIPQGARVFPNAQGTAPGVAAVHENTVFYFMPGVPYEMKPLFEDHILPDMLSRRGQNVHFESRFLKTFGVTESDLDNRLADITQDRTQIHNARLGYRVDFPEVMLKLSVWGKEQRQVTQDLAHVLSSVHERVGEFVYAEGEDSTLEQTLVENLIKKQKTVAIAESCTGGLIANRITNVNGASQVFMGGVVSYSNALKMKLLDVPQEVLDQHGAVSPECAKAMVEGVKKITQADFCAAVTGIAGPTGGTKEKPVGTVHVATLCEGKFAHKKYNFPHGRQKFKILVSSIVLKNFLDSLA